MKNLGQGLPAFEAHGEQEHKYTTCYMCACRCGVRITLEGGKIRHVQGNPNHPVNRGVLCGKGNAAIMKQCSPAKLQQPLRRKAGAARGSGEFEPISWDEALSLLTERLQKIRETNPNQLAFFTGRDQMQALTGLWATQFGTLNWAAHGGLCSVNMAAAGLMTTGFSFWEFGEPDWERARLFLLWGVAEDHASNPIKIGLKKLKERGAKIVAINPVRTGYQAIADEWIAITPGTDGLLALSLVYCLLARRRLDEDFLVRQTNLPFLIDEEGLFVRDENQNPLIWCQEAQAARSAFATDSFPALWGEYEVGGKQVQTAMTAAAAEFLDEKYNPRYVARECGIDAATIERLAEEVAACALDNTEAQNIACEWTDWTGQTHSHFAARPVAMHAMRGISAHSNGFQTCRALHFLQALVGAIDAPGSHLAKPPYPKHPPAVPSPARESAAGSALAAPPLGIPRSPAELAIDKDGNPLRIDKAFSWDAPLSAHGMMHMVIANAARHDPYPIDTLIIFMANMAWNSSMNTGGTIEHLTAKNDDGSYRIPFIVTADAFHSEMVNYSDLVLPDTTYLERYDTISLLDRPISEAHAVCDAIRQPVMEREHDTRAWQEVLVELASRLQLPAFTNADGARKFNDYQDFITRYEKEAGIGFLAGWRGADGGESLRGAPNPNQWQRYIDNECFFREELPPHTRYYRHINRDYLEYAKRAGWVASEQPIFMELYSERLRVFQRAGEGKADGKDGVLPPHAHQRERLQKYFRPLPFYYPPFSPTHRGEAGSESRDESNAESSAESKRAHYPLHAVTQRPMFMYHSWDSQNAWLRQIAATNVIYINSNTAHQYRIEDGDWVWLRSPHGRIKARAQLMDGVAANTVWTYNAIGKAAGTWGLNKNAPESNTGFILNHLISEFLSPSDGYQHSNSDPITGQAAWYDLKIAIVPLSRDEKAAHLQMLAAEEEAANESKSQTAAQTIRYHTHHAVNLTRSLRDVLLRK